MDIHVQVAAVDLQIQMATFPRMKTIQQERELAAVDISGVSGWVVGVGIQIRNPLMIPINIINRWVPLGVTLHIIETLKIIMPIRVILQVSVTLTICVLIQVSVPLGGMHRRVPLSLKHKSIT